MSGVIPKQTIKRKWAPASLASRSSLPPIAEASTKRRNLWKPC